MSELEKIFEDLREYRKEHFQVTSKASKLWNESDIILEITTNGTQWICIGLTKEEIPKVIAELQKHL